MKKLLILIILTAVVLSAIYLFKDSEVSETPSPTGNNTGMLEPDPSNATFIFNDGPVTLSNGKAERAIAPGSAFTEEVVILDNLAYGDINGDGKTDTALIIAGFGSGSGTFIYAAGFVSGPINYEGTDAILIGGRVSPQSVSIDNGVVTVEYLDRGPEEALASEPTIPSSKQFVWRDERFQER